jgi:hypothetical protein
MNTFLEFWNLVQDEIKSSAKPSGDRAVFTFGRLNPPTIGHAKLIQATMSAANKDGADYYIFVSQTGPDKSKKDGDGFKKDPLAYGDKLRFLERLFPEVSFMNVEMANNPFNAAYWLRDNGYKHVKLVAGSDRIPQYEAQFAKYIQHADPKLNLGFESFQVISAGERDPDADGAAGASASLARHHVKSDNYNEFLRVIPNTLTRDEQDELFTLIKAGMISGMSEDKADELFNQLRIRSEN